MESSDDKHWAQRYLIDPLNEPDPSQETGPGSSFLPEPVGKASPAAKLASPPTSPFNRLSKNPYRNRSSSSKGPPGTISSLARSTSLTTKSPTTPTSEPPTRSNTHSHSRNTSDALTTPTSPNHRQGTLSNLNESQSTTGSGVSGNRPRGSSLTSRFPGDKSHQPLATLAKEKQIADRSSHMVKKHHIRPDTIDALDNIAGTSYHHSGPYDATLYARNNSIHNSPIQAVAGTNAEALKATPREKILDSVRGHKPLDGVAAFPPGTADRNGNVYQYEEGDNMMIGGGHEPEGGAYKRWPGVNYLPEDVKGKGEPSYSIEKAVREKERKGAGEGDGGIEMTNRTSPNGARRRHVNGDGESTRSENETRADGEDNGGGAAVRRSASSSKRLSGGGLKRRIGSIKKHLQGDT